MSHRRCCHSQAVALRARPPCFRPPGDRGRALPTFSVSVLSIWTTVTTTAAPYGYLTRVCRSLPTGDRPTGPVWYAPCTSDDGRGRRRPSLRSDNLSVRPTRNPLERRCGAHGATARRAIPRRQIAYHRRGGADPDRSRARTVRKRRTVLTSVRCLSADIPIVVAYHRPSDPTTLPFPAVDAGAAAAVVAAAASWQSSAPPPPPGLPRPRATNEITRFVSRLST